MENTINSCLMLAINLETPVSLGSLFAEPDLKDTGVEVDSHITLLYAQGKEIEHSGLLQDIQDILGDTDYNWLLEMIKNDEDYKVLDSFDLSLFTGDSDYVILKLRKGTALYKILSLINKGLSIKYGVKSDFAEYTPHITLAELEPGEGEKYMKSETLLGVLEDSIYSIEDLFISYGTSSDVEDRKQIYLTSEKCIDRFFRILRLKKELIEL